MPSNIILQEKKAQLDSLVEKLKTATAGVLVSYKGITVEQDTAMRAELRKAGVEYKVLKNTMTSRACDAVGYGDMKPYLEGMTALAISQDDPIAPAKILKDYADKIETFEIKAGFMNGQVLTDQQMEEISALPSKDALYAKVLGTMLAPITSLAVCLGQILEQKGGSVEPAADAEPAAEAEA